MALVPIAVQRRNISILEKAYVSRKNMDPSEVKTLLEWTPSDAWDVNSTDENSSVLSMLGRRSTESGDSTLKEWVDLMFHVMETRGGLPKAEVWAETLREMYQRNSLDDFPDVSKQVNRWFDIAPDTYWKACGEELLRTAFDKKHWDQVDQILEKGISPDIKNDCKMNYYGKGESLPLLVGATNEKIAKILVKYGADPFQKVEDKTALDWLESRNEGNFESATIRRDVLKVFREDAEKRLALVSPEKALEKKVKTLWSVIADRPSWMDIQTAAVAIDKNLKDVRGPFGENMLQWTLLNCSQFAPNVIRMKLSDKSWHLQQDKFGLSSLNYLHLSNNALYMREEIKEKFTKAMAAPLNEVAPKTVEEVWSNLEKMWKWQNENTNKLAGLPNKRKDIVWFLHGTEIDSHKGIFEVGGAYDLAVKEFKKQLGTVEGFNRAAPFYMELATNVGVASIPHKEKYKSNARQDDDLCIRKLLDSPTANKLTDESKNFALRVLVHDVYTVSSSSYYIENFKLERAAIVKEISEWVKHGASLKDFMQEIEEGKTGYAENFKQKMKDSETFKSLWLTEIRPELERAELSKRALGSEVKKRPSGDLFAL